MALDLIDLNDVDKLLLLPRVDCSRLVILVMIDCLELSVMLELVVVEEMMA